MVVFHPSIHYLSFEGFYEGGGVLVTFPDRITFLFGFFFFFLLYTYGFKSLSYVWCYIPTSVFALPYILILRLFLAPKPSLQTISYRRSSAERSRGYIYFICDRKFLREVIIGAVFCQPREDQFFQSIPLLRGYAVLPEPRASLNQGPIMLLLGH